MHKDFEIIQHAFPDEITIYPIGDVHLGANGWQEKEFIELLEEIKDNPKAYIVLIGDLMDNGIKSGKGIGVYEQTMRPSEQKRYLAELLKPVKDKILAVIPGNHEKRSTKECDDNPLYDVCCKLDIEDLYRENLAILKIKLGNRNDVKCKKRQTYVFLLHHGKGSAGTAVKKDKDYLSSFEGADGIITGHVHEGHVNKISKRVIDPRNNQVLNKNQTIIICTSFLSEAPYATESMLPAANTEVISFDLKLGHKKILIHF